MIYLFYGGAFMPYDSRMVAELGDITTYAVDAVVNAANETLLGGGGVDGAIHRKAGKELLKACQTLGGCKTGQAKVTQGYRLPARYVIHTVGPIWHGGNHHEAELLTSCYRQSIKLAQEIGAHTIAFPAISTGVYHFPKDQATQIAVNTIDNLLSRISSAQISLVIFVCFSAEDLEHYQKILSS